MFPISLLVAIMVFQGIVAPAIINPANQIAAIDERGLLKSGHQLMKRTENPAKDPSKLCRVCGIPGRVEGKEQCIICNQKPDSGSLSFLPQCCNPECKKQGIMKWTPGTTWYHCPTCYSRLSVAAKLNH
ncbi:hypothetical protein PGT21_013690 [Puccinia graminis f. sp. tritici]|nr:hypothetical protein PGT21_013690 [Puccinia graminis f. sp. tritici]